MKSVSKPICESKFCTRKFHVVVDVRMMSAEMVVVSIADDLINSTTSTVIPATKTTSRTTLTTDTNPSTIPLTYPHSPTAVTSTTTPMGPVSHGSTTANTTPTALTTLPINNTLEERQQNNTRSDTTTTGDTNNSVTSPVVLVNQIADMTVEKTVGQTLEIQCGVKNNSAHETASWWRWSQGDQKYIEVGSGAELVINKLTIEDKGVYRCVKGADDENITSEEEVDQVFTVRLVVLMQGIMDQPQGNNIFLCPSLKTRLKSMN